jgi:hypothetical protein
LRRNREKERDGRDRGARERARVGARGGARVEARGSACVVARGRSREAHGESGEHMRKNVMEEIERGSHEDVLGVRANVREKIGDHGFWHMRRHVSDRVWWRVWDRVRDHVEELVEELVDWRVSI